MTVLVTGAAGFIGEYLVDRLLKEGLAIRALDRFSKNKEKYFANKYRGKKVSLIKADIAKKNQVKPAYFAGVSWVFHLAGVSRVAESFLKPRLYLKINVSGTLNALLASSAAGVEKFIYSASASCYGDSTLLPTPENAEILIESPYALTKYMGECYVRHWDKVYKLPSVSLRFVSVYGPKSNKYGSYGSILSLFMRQKEQGKPYTIIGDGSQTRDLVFIDDATEALILAAKSKLSNQVFNVGGGKTYSIKKIVSLLCGPVTYLPKRPWEASQKQVDISKIKTVLGWQPKVSLEEGIKRVLKSATGNAKCKNQNAK